MNGALKTLQKVCLVGSGGVGTIASVVLEKSGCAEVTAVLRSRYSIIKERGWDIDSCDHGTLKGWRPTRVVSSVNDAAISETGESVAYNFVVVSTKQLPDKFSLASLIAPLVTPSKTAIVLIQNGLDIELPLIAAFPTNTIMSAVSMIGSLTTGPYQLSQPGPDVLTIGPHFHECGGRSRDEQFEKTKEFVDMYNAGLRDVSTIAFCTLTDDMPKARWHKLLWNSTFNTLCALMRMNVGELQSSKGRETLLIPMMWEVLRIAKAAGHTLEESEIHRLAYRLPDDCEYRPSMLLDMDYGRPMEIEVILGNPLARARELGVEAPTMRTVYELLKLERWKTEQAQDQPPKGP